jgi:hypothetical protein
MCGKVKKLCYSHYLPRGLYLFARAAELKNPNPVMSVNGELKQISDQYQDYLLCESCEGRLSALGEKWVLANLPTSYGAEFPLHKVLEPITPKLIEERVNVYDVSGVEAFDMRKLVYFGLSVFWRGGVHDWKTRSGLRAPRVGLGSHEEPIRKFLLDDEPLPKSLTIAINVWPYRPVLPLVHPVVQEQMPDCSRYWFYVPGLHFFLFAGPSIPQDAKGSDATTGVVAVDLDAADSLHAFIKSAIKTHSRGPKIEGMFKEIAAIRAGQE